METTRLSSKGQLVLPKSVRDAHGWVPGTEFEVEDTADGVLIRSRKTLEPKRLDQVAGSLRYSGPAKSVADMDRAIAAEIDSRRDRGRY